MIEDRMAHSIIFFHLLLQYNQVGGSREEITKILTNQMTKINQIFSCMILNLRWRNTNMKGTGFIYSRGIIWLKILRRSCYQECLQMFGLVHSSVPSLLFYFSPSLRFFFYTLNMFSFLSFVFKINKSKWHTWFIKLQLQIPIETSTLRR